MDALTLDRPLPTKIGLIGFADSRDEAPYDDPSWEMWGVNDVYAHVPRIDRSFELHHDAGLELRRNPQYADWLKKGKVPVYRWNLDPAYPSVVQYPLQEVIKVFGDPYFTNSVSEMTALALLLLTEESDNGVRKVRQGVELGMWGVDMADGSEYAAQRPSCEYYVGLARGMGIPVHIPATSDLLKATGVYGLHTTAPLRIKTEKRMANLRNHHQQLLQNEANLQAQLQACQAQRNQIKGAIGAFKYVQGVWTIATDNTEITDKTRALAAPKSDGSVFYDDDGELNMKSLLEGMEKEEADIPSPI